MLLHLILLVAYKIRIITVLNLQMRKRRRGESGNLLLPAARPGWSWRLQRHLHCRAWGKRGCPQPRPVCPCAAPEHCGVSCCCQGRPPPDGFLATPKHIITVRRIDPDKSQISLTSLVAIAYFMWSKPVLIYLAGHFAAEKHVTHLNRWSASPF